MQENNGLEEHIECINSALIKYGELRPLALINETRKMYDKNKPLEEKKAKLAVNEAEKRGIIKKAIRSPLGEVYILTK